VGFDPSFAVSPVERHPGWRDVRCRIVVTPRRGPVTLGDGIESAVHDLGFSYDIIGFVLDTVGESIDSQLMIGPRAVVAVPGGCTIVVELLPW
jgi:hypothetical protein